MKAFDIHVVAPTGPHLKSISQFATVLETSATRPTFFGQKGSGWDGSKAFGKTAVRGEPLTSHVCRR
jgi:hypothetical protein